MKKELDPTLEASIKAIKEHVIRDCDLKRKFYLPIWNRANYYWNDIQDIYWDPNINDWITFRADEGETEFDALKDANKNANVYRADGESLIAAATIGNLSIRFYPEDADKIVDIEKSRSYSAIAEYLQIKNNLRDIRRNAFMIRYNMGLVASYVYYERDPKYGMITTQEMGSNKVLVINFSCPECDYKEQKKYSTPEEIAGQPMESMPPCPECQQRQQMEIQNQSQGGELPPMPPINEQGGMNQPQPPIMTAESEAMEEEIFVKNELEEPKGCAKIELFDPTQLRVPFYATDPDKINYVVIQTEMHYADVRAMMDNIDPLDISPNVIDTIEALSREQQDYFGTYSSTNLVTVTRAWVLPSMYNILIKGSDDDKVNIKTLTDEYPEGFRAIFIKDKLFKCFPEDMRKRWSFVRSPLDSHVYIRPLGNGTIPIQDMVNDLIYIVITTIKHSIGDTWVDSRIINSNIIEKLAQKPGQYLPVFTEDNRPIAEYFFSTKNATVSREVDAFFNKLEQLRQLVGGIFPSVFGGRFQQGGSQTFGEYKQSRDQALQRISMPADNIDDFLTETISKATELYAENMRGDETYSVDSGDSYVNKTLKKPPSSGKISRVQPKRSEQFPVTWEQERAFGLELLDKQIEPITAALLSPENIPISSKIIGIPGMKVPGEADRNKQLIEIQELLKGQSPDGINPSIPIDPEIDNHDVHIITGIAWAVSPEGMYNQKVNPSGFKNVLCHIMAHKNFQVQQQQQQQMPPQENKNEQTS